MKDLFSPELGVPKHAWRRTIQESLDEELQSHMGQKNYNSVYGWSGSINDFISSTISLLRYVHSARHPANVKPPSLPPDTSNCHSPSDDSLGGLIIVVPFLKHVSHTISFSFSEV